MEEEEEDCIILEISEEMKEKRMLNSLEKSNKSYKIIGSIEDCKCSHHYRACSYQCTNSPAIGVMTIYCGLKEGGNLCPGKFFDLPYCQKHIEYQIRSARRKGEETIFHLLPCSLCQREELTICSHCANVFQVPDLVDCYYCPLCVGNM